MAAVRGSPARHPPELPQDELTLRPGERRDLVLRLIRSARERLILSVFRCTDYLILDELAEAVSRGVRVSALLTPRTKGEEAKQLRNLGSLLEGMGAEVHRYSDRIVKYHAKYMVADAGPALIGTLNFTAKCFTETCDFQLLTWDPAVVSSLLRLFETDAAAPEASLPGGLSDRLIIGPDCSRARFTALLEGAAKSIRIIDHKLSDAQIVALLKEKRRKGVAVQVLGAGEVAGLRSHGKMMVVDGRVAVVGSIALSPLNLDFRREVAVAIDEPRLVSRLARFFQQAARSGVRRAAAGGGLEE